MNAQIISVQSTEL